MLPPQPLNRCLVILKLPDPLLRPGLAAFTPLSDGTVCLVSLPAVARGLASGNGRQGGSAREGDVTSIREGDPSD